MARVAVVLLFVLGVSADPLACQPNAQQPMLPIFHTIGNVTQHDDGSLSVEPINDASGITFYGGLYHLWHQCCQNHWDHVISADLIHWQRLPPPIQPVTLRTWDGSISMVDAAFGGPVILYDAQDGKMPLPADSAILGVARLANLSDPYLMTWTRAENNPVNFSGAPIAFPGQVWRNGDHFNFVGQGSRFQTSDPTFHSWTNMGAFNAQKEHSGQWTMPVPNQVGGAPPPPGSPNLAINVNGGADYELGESARPRPRTRSRPRPVRARVRARQPALSAPQHTRALLTFACIPAAARPLQSSVRRLLQPRVGDLRLRQCHCSP